jgi:uncharacterized protein (TIGR00159 family)
MAHFFTELIQSIRMADLFDVAIISVLIYAVLIWFEATASRFVLLGIFVLSFIYLMARLFHLYLTAIVLQAFFAIFLIALVIIFQEELRRFFERISIWSFVRKPNMLSGYPEIEIISTTIHKLARKRIGALMVIRGVDPLDRHLEGGYDLDGRLSEPLLESIFDPHSLGHDGAAIIEHGRLSKFGCRLPLSNNVRVLGTRGTRHGAALGLAEKSDALCIIVSEETGAVSLAQGERLRELTDPPALQASLERYYLEKFPKGHWTLVRWIKERSWEKAASILLSCALWFVFVYQTGTIRRDFVLPIEYRNLKSDWVIEEPRPKEVTVTLLGRARAFDLLDMRNLKVVVDTSDIEQGVQEIMLPVDSVYRPSSLSVVDIEPDKVRVTAYQLVQANLPIEVQTHGKAPSGYRISRIEVSPESIPVLVPSREKNNSLKVLTETIDLRKLKETTTLTPSIILPTGARLEGQRQPRVDVKVEIKHSS